MTGLRARHRVGRFTAAALGLALGASIGAAPASASPVVAREGGAAFQAGRSAPPAWLLTGGRRFAVDTQAVTLTSGDAADVYVPRVGRAERARLTDAFPVIALLQGANVDKRFYSGVAGGVAAQGFVVVVPNRLRPPQTPPPGLFTSPAVVTAVLETATTLDGDATSPLYRVTDTGSLGLLGHSFGGAVGLFAAAGVCEPPLCAPPFARPPQLRAAALYGTNIATGTTLDRDLDTSGVAVALVQGTVDGVAPPVEAATTYPSLERPRALISIRGANHYGITDVDDPAGALPDPNDPTIPQQTSVALVARWSGLWLRSRLLDDPFAATALKVKAATHRGAVSVRLD